MRTFSQVPFKVPMKGFYWFPAEKPNKEQPRAKYLPEFNLHFAIELVTFSRVLFVLKRHKVRSAKVMMDKKEKTPGWAKQSQAASNAEKRDHENKTWQNALNNLLKYEIIYLFQHADTHFINCWLQIT